MAAISKILCPVDFFPASERAAHYAAGLATGYGARLLLLHVVTPVVPTAYRYAINTVESGRRMEEASSKEIKKLAAKLQTAGVRVDTEVQSGDVRTAIEETISSYKPDLIAMGTHSRKGVDRWVMGSITEWMIRRSPSPLLTISANEKLARPAFRHILVTTDFSEGTSEALTYALSIAEAHNSRMTVLHVIDSTSLELSGSYRTSLLTGVQQHIDDLIAAHAGNRRGVTGRVEQGVPYQVILRILENEKPNLLIMNIHGKGLLERALIGSTAERIVRGADRPVLLIPPLSKTRKSR